MKTISPKSYQRIKRKYGHIRKVKTFDNSKKLSKLQKLYNQAAKDYNELLDKKRKALYDYSRSYDSIYDNLRGKKLIEEMMKRLIDLDDAYFNDKWNPYDIDHSEYEEMKRIINSNFGSMENYDLLKEFKEDYIKDKDAILELLYKLFYTKIKNEIRYNENQIIKEFKKYYAKRKNRV